MRESPNENNRKCATAAAVPKHLSGMPLHIARATEEVGVHVAGGGFYGSKGPVCSCVYAA